MSSQTIGLLIGGLLPALLFGLTNVFAKATTDAGIGLALYVIFVGLALVATGCVLFLFLPDRTLSFRSGSYALAMGFTWALGITAIAIALTQYGSPIGKLVPLFNMNTLVSVLIALWVFSEWKQMDVWQLLLGSVLIVAGGTLVAKA